ncbi:hypothetical protein, partial [Aetokthonos hydrillicola]
MIYIREDGTQLSWKQYHEYLLKEEPDNLEALVRTRLRLLAQQEDDPEYYYELIEELIGMVQDGRI